MLIKGKIKKMHKRVPDTLYTCHCEALAVAISMTRTVTARSETTRQPEFLKECLTPFFLYIYIAFSRC